MKPQARRARAIVLESLFNDDGGLASEKARGMNRRSPERRRLSKGPKKRAGGNHGNGQRTRFKPGQNSHTGEVFRRGPDEIPRGSGLLMLKVIAAGKRQTIDDNLEKYVSTPRGAFEFTKNFADRTDGKPTQKHEVTTPRQTIFKKDPDAAPPLVQGLRGAQNPAMAEGVLVDEEGAVFVAVRQ